MASSASPQQLVGRLCSRITMSWNSSPQSSFPHVSRNDAQA
eukprot:CAMPEP_0182913364 /NCGR_PEP_ID=MMETSP0034_2-20130328/38003_1 /TAXON_ID=156128 /ORGANISM="Nephroselmis pyriformis, Strain CCMP717" /LENGTH=40 /DNA_ID= /DNA_START= /DNA_END= /DNA_ORIENTATION=